MNGRRSRARSSHRTATTSADVDAEIASAAVIAAVTVTVVANAEREPREEYSLPENYTPIVLPGESISKYSKPQSGPAMHAEVTPAEARHFDSAATELASAPGPEAGGRTVPATAAEPAAPDVAPASTTAVSEAAPDTTADASVFEAELLPYRQPTTPTDHVMDEKPGRAGSRASGNPCRTLGESVECSSANPSITLRLRLCQGRNMKTSRQRLIRKSNGHLAPPRNHWQLRLEVGSTYRHR